MFSIITATIPRKTLNRCIRSVINQTFEGEYEHICVVDTNKYSDFGHSVRRDAWDNTKYEWIGYLDSDDWYDEDCLRQVAEVARVTDKEFIYFPAFRLGSRFFPNYHSQNITSIQYFHRKYDKEGNPIRFTSGLYGHDNVWWKEMIAKYEVEVLDTKPLVYVDQIGNGK